MRPPKPPRRKSSMVSRAGVMKRRISNVSATSADNVPSLSLMQELFGDDFPEAFASGSGYARKSKKSILDLPAELLAAVCEHVSKLDLKRLRLVNKRLAEKVELRIDRVYVSPNRANLECLKRILGHKRYCNQVQEIVWDDAQLEEYPSLEGFGQAIHDDERQLAKDIETRLEHVINGQEDDSPEYQALEYCDLFQDGRLTDIAKGILLQYDDQTSRDLIARSAAMMSVEESYAIYQDLYRGQQEIMKKGDDVAALHHALAGFPNLRRVTLTSEAWRPWNNSPIYNTPFFRSLPPGFRKPSVWPWLGPRPRPTPSQTAHIDKAMSQDIRRLPTEWRGYSILVSTLVAMPNPKIEEFIIDTGNECTGLPHQLFAAPNMDFTLTLRMLQHLPLKKLKLAINSHGAAQMGYTYLTSGLLFSALNAMPYLESLDLNTNSHGRRNSPQACWIDPTTLFPSPLLKRLKQFALRNTVLLGNLSELISEMTSVKSITLDNIWSTSVGGFETSLSSLFHLLRDEFALNGRKPRFEVILPIRQDGVETSRSWLVGEEISAFLYDGGECPFPCRQEMGWIVDDRDLRYCRRA